MSEIRGTSYEIESYLKRTGWKADDRGVSGALWRNQTAAGDSAVIAVPSRVQAGSAEWRALIARIANFENRLDAHVEFDVEHPYVDVTRFRAANEYIIDRTIPLVAGVGLVSTAYKILRASATIARQNRAQIGGNFSKLGDEIVNRARLGHSERGSYILPVLMPLSIQERELAGGFWEDPSGVLGSVPLETSERRVTRTMAAALDAIGRIVIDPAREPRANIVDPLVASGVCKELVMAVEDVLSDPAVSVFEAGFSWARGVTAPSGLPEKVTVPSEARDLLAKTARLLRRSKKDPGQRVSGPIVQVRHLPDDPFGEVALQTMRHGRYAEIRVLVKEDRISQALEWMKTSRTVVVEGQVVRDPGRPLRIDSPALIYPLDESLLFPDK